MNRGFGVISSRPTFRSIKRVLVWVLPLTLDNFSIFGVGETCHRLAARVKLALRPQFHFHRHFRSQERRLGSAASLCEDSHKRLNKRNLKVSESKRSLGTKGTFVAQRYSRMDRISLSVKICRNQLASSLSS